MNKYLGGIGYYGDEYRHYWVFLNEGLAGDGTEETTHIQVVACVPQELATDDLRGCEMAERLIEEEIKPEILRQYKDFILVDTKVILIHISGRRIAFNIPTNIHYELAERSTIQRVLSSFDYTF